MDLNNHSRSLGKQHFQTKVADKASLVCDDFIPKPWFFWGVNINGTGELR